MLSPTIQKDNLVPGVSTGGGERHWERGCSINGMHVKHYIIAKAVIILKEIQLDNAEKGLGEYSRYSGEGRVTSLSHFHKLTFLVPLSQT